MLDEVIQALTVQPGESIALVGHTGAGKSSIAKLIARFYEFQEGDILIDDISIRNFDLTEYRKQIGINSLNLTKLSLAFLITSFLNSSIFIALVPHRTLHASSLYYPIQDS
jgi:ABC-type multidrug transport system fused ATPase/permease subunit